MSYEVGAILLKYFLGNKLFCYYVNKHHEEEDKI